MDISTLVPNTVTQRNTQQVVERSYDNKTQDQAVSNEVESQSSVRDGQNNFNQVEVVLELEDASSASDLPRGSVLDITV